MDWHAAGLSKRKDGGAVLFGLDNDGYDPNGNITAVMRTLRTGANGNAHTFDFGYSYDYLNRLSGCAAGSGVYTYAMNEFGNITARTQTAGGGGNLPQSMALAVSAATGQAGWGQAFDAAQGNSGTRVAPQRACDELLAVTPGLRLPPLRWS